MPPKEDDPVAAKSLFLASYMSQHVDTLVAYILFYLQHPTWGGGASAKTKKENAGLSPRDITQVKMLKISSRDMSIQYRDARNGPKADLKTLTIPFDPPMLSYDEVRPRLTQMKTEAEAGIGMSKRPTISIYRFPTYRNTLIVVSMILLWVGTATQENENGTFGRLRRLSGGWWTIRATGMFMLATHAAEAAFQFRSCQRFQVPPQQTILWTVTAFFLGFAGLLQFRQVVREARIASINKSQ